MEDLRSRENAIAPDSMSLERHRLIWLYLKEKTNFFSDNLKFAYLEYCFIKLFKIKKFRLHYNRLKFSLGRY